jgi:hypothetical protein
MPKYKPLEYNSEVMDVLSCIILGYNRVKDMIKILNRPQSTISEKLRFLRKSKVVVKKKWIYEPNWEELISLLRKHVKNIIELYVEKKREREKFMKLFDDKRLKNMLNIYVNMHFEKINKNRKEEKIQLIKQTNLFVIIWEYFLGLTQMEDEELRKIDERFLILKNKIKALSPEKFFFLKCEGVESPTKISSLKLVNIR